jgi:hypothetical protein
VWHVTRLEVTICDLKPEVFEMPIWHLKNLTSPGARRNIKSIGNRCMFRFTARLSAPVVTPYSRAKSTSNITFSPLTRKTSWARYSALFMGRNAPIKAETRGI